MSDQMIDLDGMARSELCLRAQAIDQANDDTEDDDDETP